MSCRVLVIDDNRDIADSLRDILELEGCIVATAYNGRDALELLRGGVSPSLILLDLRMPVMDGIQFRNEQLGDPALRDIPVVVLSADRNAATQATSLGLTCITKPVELSQLLDAVDRLARAA